MVLKGKLLLNPVATFVASFVCLFEYLVSSQKEINPEYSLGRLMLKLQYFVHLMRRANSLDKTLMLGKIKSKRRRGRQDEIVR